MARYDVFVSYRRDGGYDTAKHLYGYHDLVLGNNSVYEWDGKKYVCGDDSIAVPEQVR